MGHSTFGRGGSNGTFYFWAKPWTTGADVSIVDDGELTPRVTPLPLLNRTTCAVHPAVARPDPRNEAIWAVAARRLATRLVYKRNPKTK